jgi:4-amino-4-deoxy-L-arabinose transferase-like glycosyltransferase
MNEIFMILIYAVVIFLLFLTMVMKKKVHYAISGLMLILLGVLPILYNNRIIDFNIESFSIMKFIAYFFVLFAARDLFKEGFQEENIKLKIPTMLFAIALLIFTTIPTLNNMNVLVIDLPNYPPMVDYVIYIISGIFLIFGMFTLIQED